MNDREYRLHKDVSTIFKGTALPEDIARRCPVRPASAVCPPDPQVTGADRRTDIPVVHVAAPTCPVKDRHIEVLMGSVECTRDHICYRSGFETLCRARPLLGGRLLECLERGLPCCHRLSFLGRAVCRCEIRRYIARRLGR